MFQGAFYLQFNSRFRGNLSFGSLLNNYPEILQFEEVFKFLLGPLHQELKRCLRYLKMVTFVFHILHEVKNLLSPVCIFLKLQIKLLGLCCDTRFSGKL